MSLDMDMSNITTKCLSTNANNKAVCNSMYQKIIKEASNVSQYAKA